jgi:integrase
MVMEGVPLKTVGDILGHKKIEMTMRYSHLSPDHRKQAVERLPDYQGAGKTCHKSGTSGDGTQ